MAEIIEKTFYVKKTRLFIAAISSIIIACFYFIIPAFETMPEIFRTLHHMLTAFLGIVVIGYMIWLILFNPLKIVINSVGIHSSLFIGNKMTIEWDKLNKIENYGSSFAHGFWPIFKYASMKEKGTKKWYTPRLFSSQLYIPLSLKNKAEFDKIMREMIDDEKVLKKLGVV